MRTIIVEKYNAKWRSEFEKAYDFYSKLLKDIDLKIEHVGSTSVEGLSAKPILDIDIIVEDNESSRKVIEKLESVEYIHIGNLGLEGREAFRYEKDNKYISWMTHNLYVCLADSENLINHLLFRNHLRKNKESVKEYSRIKSQLAKKHPHDIGSYLDGKTDFITRILEEEGMNSSELKRIEKINKLK